MNYSLNHIKLKSNWFDGNESKYNIIGYNGLNLYLNLFRFYVNRQENVYTFITCISLLRREIGYSTLEIADLLKMMRKNGLIEILNISRWDQIESKGKVYDDKTLVIVATDVPNTKREKNDKGQENDTPVTEDDYYVPVDLDLLDVYKEKGLSERYYPLYCLLRKLSNGNAERKSFMGVNKMAKILGYGSKQVNEMIHELNRHHLLYSDYKDNDKGGKKFEHRLADTVGLVGVIDREYGDKIDKRVKRDKDKRGKRDKIKGNGKDIKRVL